ncbi:hypothetical protein DEU56DRAFT_755658 [Suillus clintonianus]|uniref:uncharacterized protein n=1 Tax=Suillus clintonianus TaxID=1904413 RepID=UPI001B867DF5|nr:uncharacterized protein DEU56DRAFT_755658 [Suillus clintonianus]KAG2138934.1 hypothetical protein DEU56DRAFT_755658 [Suillus clintonianus]
MHARRKDRIICRSIAQEDEVRWPDAKTVVERVDQAGKEGSKQLQSFKQSVEHKRLEEEKRRGWWQSYNDVHVYLRFILSNLERITIVGFYMTALYEGDAENHQSM